MIDFGKTVGGIAGAIVGTVFGPIGSAAGATVGKEIGDVLEDAVVDEVKSVKTVVPSAEPKPLAKSKSAWLGLLLVLVPPALEYGAGLDWAQWIGASNASIVVGVLVLLLRLWTAAPITRG